MRSLVLTCACLIGFATSSGADETIDRGSGMAGTMERAPRCPTNQVPGAGSGTERLDTGRLVGKTVRRARRLARRHGCSVRVVKRDGELLIVTQDFSPYRINVAVRDHVVKRVMGIG